MAMKIFKINFSYW